MPVFLPEFKGSLLARIDISAMTIDEHNAFKTMIDEIIREVVKHIEIKSRVR